MGETHRRGVLLEGYHAHHQSSWLEWGTQEWAVAGINIAQRHFLTLGNLERAETVNLTCQISVGLETTPPSVPGTHIYPILLTSEIHIKQGVPFVGAHYPFVKSDNPSCLLSP